MENENPNNLERKRERSASPVPSLPVSDQEQLEPFLAEELSEEEGEDLFGDQLENDYRENLKLDRYDETSADEEDFDMMDRDVRLVAEAQMRRRDREQGRLDPFQEDDDLLEERMPIRRRRRDPLDDIVMDDDEVMPLDQDALKDVKGPLNEYVSMEAPRRALRQQFHRFLVSFVSQTGESVYGERIKRMCEQESASLEIDYMHLYSTDATLTYFLINSPTEVLQIFDEVAMDVVLQGFEHYADIHPQIHVRIANLPVVENLRDLRQSYLNTLVKVSGTVTKRTGVFPQLKYVKYDCVKCGALLGPFYQDSNREIKLNRCSNCQSKGPFNVNSEQTVYREYQRMTIQETPGSVLAGRLPRSREVILLWDLVDCARPGEEIELTGIYRNNFDMSMNLRNGFPVFTTVIEANHISKRTDMYSTTKLTEEDQRQIRQLARDPRIKQRIIKSIAPSIFGHDDLKTALALSMFGGVFKNPQGKHRLRGDINVLMMGDPGTAKSQFLKYVEKTANRAIYTTGQGASAVGLTAAVHKDPVTREWTLEGGALVMADKGVCLIDEFDKMNDKDRTSIHEAMEQQSISISKAGIIATLHARCAVVAAANPIFGKYNPQVPFSQNVELTEPILSRFDILCVVRDVPDADKDTDLARFVINSHMRSHPSNKENEVREEDPDIIPQELLRKYIIFARDHYKPTIREVDIEKLEKLYADLRRESLVTGGIPITVRYLESIIRMSEAFAKMHLRETVNQNDLDHAIAVCVRSFIQCQKTTIKRSLEKTFDKYLSKVSDSYQLLMHRLSQLKQEYIRHYYYTKAEMPAQIEIPREEFELAARELGIADLTSFFQSHLFAHSYTLQSNTIVSK